MSIDITPPAGIAGPASSTDNALPVFDETTGRLLKNSTLAYGAGGLTITKITEQLRLRYDAGNYLSTTVNASGVVVWNSLSNLDYQWAFNGTTYLRFGNNALTMSLPAGGFFLDSNGNPAAGRSRFSVSGTADSGPGLSDGGATNTLGLCISGADKVVLTSTYFGLGPGLTSKVGGTIFDDYTDGATTHTDGTEDTLYTHTLQASQFSANGDKIAGMYQVAIVGHAISTDRIRLYVAGTAIFDTTALNFPLSAQLTLEFEVIRVSATVLRASVAATTSSATVIAYSQYVEITGLTLSNSQVVALKAIATGTNSAAGDVTAKLGTINWQPAA